MNERIVKLFMESVDSNYIPVPIEDHIPSWTEKFAELIVRETVKEMSHQLYWHGVEQSNNPSFYKAIEKTLEHFGVE